MDNDSAVPTQQTGMSYPTITLGSKELVNVISINSPSDFYVQMKSNSDILTTLMNDITTYAEGGSAPVASVNTGMLCVARYAEDEKWYRACVVTLTADVASVKFVDYGNQNDVHLSSILEISPELTTVPVQAVSCSLLGAKAAAFDWSDEEINTFSSLITGEKNIEAHFVSKNGDKYEVILRDVDTDEIVNKSLGCTSDDIESALVPKPVSFLVPASSVPEFATAEDQFSNESKEMEETEVESSKEKNMPEKASGLTKRKNHFDIDEDESPVKRRKVEPEVQESNDKMLNKAQSTAMFTCDKCGLVCKSWEFKRRHMIICKLK